MSEEQLLWIGCLESDEEFINKSKKGYNLASAQVSQKNILYGIEINLNKRFDSINGSVLPPYPIYKDKLVLENRWSHEKGTIDVSVGYKNIKYLNRFFCKRAMLKEAKRWINSRYKGGGLVIYTYSMRSAPMEVACYIKKKIKNAKIILIITDLPQFMDLGESKFKKFLKKIDWININKLIRSFDGFILYASKMAEFLNISSNKWMLMEGLYDIDENMIFDEKNNNGLSINQSIMYSGKVDFEYGIDILIEAFKKIKNDKIELWITGGGNAEKYIKEQAQIDKRIKYFGFLPSRKEVLALQKRAKLLINMRLPSEAASDYSFPSKLFEYMATGVPVLTFRLGGIPIEYYQYLIVIEDIKDLKTVIEESLNMTVHKRSKLGESAKKFILEYKNKSFQCKRIINFVNKQVKYNE